MKLKLALLLISVFSVVACSPSDETASVKPIQESSATNDVVTEVEESATNDIVPEINEIELENSAVKDKPTPIPMSDSFENGRYFLTSQTTENGIENIQYIREGNDSTSYAKMQIKCTNNQIKKYSADNPNALLSADMGEWITPTPDWTDQDIVNFICK